MGDKLTEAQVRALESRRDPDHRATIDHRVVRAAIKRGFLVNGSITPSGIAALARHKEKSK